MVATESLEETKILREALIADRGKGSWEGAGASQGLKEGPPY